ncbi:DUF6242 domain-containing protein [Bacteroides caecimuris]|jgi:hypothetical protein|uniref:Uncharacterized protein n=2 Tax=Bacteroides caecimuris TaxID=1796613 RepID=A0A1C7GY48_9BACE|nr:DUF6242 domain-containing protein [Bacteroides caecimuris]ANU56277.1 hypothetical protein A4V03_00745 [Bacteroides caecimuris]OXE63743.1 hypothetical protein ADH74_12635 [Bacteroides caecimuris]QQR18879.1 hypothetical protein I5Q79_08380 [Bacteroides caecimuris]UQA31907.1 DUF6242 domain-containing protein [Bacteroides caecimuris]
MKIKFLSFIASFFMVSFVITSCLDDDNNIEYSPDATIHAFELDTIGGYGVKYKFTIDQLSCEIYNEDSLPVHADTIIDKILIKTLTTASGVVTMKDKSGNDSVLNINDSIDLRKPLTIKVWSTEALAGISPNQTKEYTIKVNVHNYDPDSLRWKYMNKIDDQIVGEQKSIIWGNEVFTYSVVGSQLYAYKNSLTNFGSWNRIEIEGLPAGKLPTSIITFQFDGSNAMLYATSDDKVYESEDGINWEASTKFGDGVELLLATLTNKDVSRICYIKKGADGQRYFYHQTNNEQQETLETYNEGKVPANFPTKNISYTVYESATNIKSVLLVGDTETATLADDSELETTIVWGYDGNKWVEFSTTSSVAYCPKYTQPSIIYYNDLVYIFGQDFSSIYVSNQGLFWKKANAKFSFPHRDWSKGGTPNPSVDPEFRGKTNYSMVLDPNTQNLWIIFSKGNASFKEEVEKEESTKATTTETHTYEHGSEVWRGRLNQLWFDLANAKK